METYPLKVGGGKRRRISSHAHKHMLVSGVAEVCIWLGLSHRQAKYNEKTLELMGSLTGCEDTKEMQECRMNEVVSRQFLTHTVSKLNQRSDATLHSR